MMSTTIRASTKVDFNVFDMTAMEKNNISNPMLSEVSSPRSTGILNILGDSEGVKLFNQFLCMRNSGHLLDFWFACKGFRSNVDPNNPDRLFQVAKVIYRTYIKSGANYAVPLPLSIKHEIVERMTSYHKGYKSTLHTQTKQSATSIDRTLFDAAQESVGTMLERMFYPEFLEYLKTNSVPATSGVTASSGMDTEKTDGNVPFSQTCSIASPKQIPNWRRKSFRQFSFDAYDDCPVVTYLPGMFSPPPPPHDRHLITAAKSLGSAGGGGGGDANSGGKLSMRMTTSWSTTSTQSPLPAIQSGSHAPCDSLTACNMDCSILCPYPDWDRVPWDPPLSSPVFSPLCTADNPQVKDHPRLPFVDAADPKINNNNSTSSSSTVSVARRASTQSNPSNQTTDVAPLLPKVTAGLPLPNPDDEEWQPSHTQTTTDPTTLSGHVAGAGPRKKDLLDRRSDQELLKPRQNLAETDPAAFVLLLTSRLEKVKESRGKIEKLLSWVNQVDEKNAVDTNCSLSGDDPLDDVAFRQNPATDQPATTNERTHVIASHCTARQLQTPPPTEIFPTAFLTKPHSAYDLKSRVCIPLRVGPVEDEDAQGILDEHCSRIWADEQECPAGPSDVHFGRQPHDQDCMIQSVLEPHDVSNRTLRRSRGGHGGSPSHATTRRRTALSARMVHSFTGEIDSTGVHNEPRRRSSMRTYNRSGTDARSTASWDSGVVTNCPHAPESPYTNGAAVAQSDLETRSIVAAASLQALSSSNTELAMANSEVTTKLVERMTRHHRRPAPESVSHPFASKLSPYQNYDLFSPPMYRSVCRHPITADPMTGKPANSAVGSGPAGMLDKFGPCMSCVQSAWRPCTYQHHQHHQQTQTGWPVSIVAVDKSNKGTSMNGDVPGGGSANSYSFPTASDTSSTFDSGISSTYDHLPMGLSQNSATDRGSRSQSLRNWHASFRETSAVGLQHQIRAPSAPRPQYASNNNNNPSLHVCQSFSSSGYPGGADGTPAASPMRPLQTAYYADKALGRAVPGCANPCCPRDDRNASRNPVQNPDLNGKCTSQPTATLQPSGCPAGSGQLLQHWLYLQTGQSVCADEGPTSQSKSSSRKQQQQQHSTHHHHHHHNRRSSAAHRRHSSKHADLGSVDRESVESKQESISRTACPPDSTEPVSATQTGLGLIVGYYLCDDPVPYRTVWTGAQTTPAASESEPHTGSNGSTPCPLLTLGQFKQLIAKKGSYRYFFKKPSDEFGTGVVHEELTQDEAVIPLWDGKVVARIERAE